jgi:hypothetical protein
MRGNVATRTCNTCMDDITEESTSLRAPHHGCSFTCDPCLADRLSELLRVESYWSKSIGASGEDMDELLVFFGLVFILRNCGVGFCFGLSIVCAQCMLEQSTQCVGSN